MEEGDGEKYKKQMAKLADKLVVHVEIWDNRNQLVYKEDCHPPSDTEYNPHFSPYRRYKIVTRVIKWSVTLPTDYTVELHFEKGLMSHIGMAWYRFYSMAIAIFSHAGSLTAFLLWNHRRAVRKLPPAAVKIP